VSFELRDMFTAMRIIFFFRWRTERGKEGVHSVVDVDMLRGLGLSKRSDCA